MKSGIYVLLSLLMLSLNADAQWLRQTDFAGVAKAKSAAFTIGNKIYVIGGVDSNSVVRNDFWEYDITGDSWIQLPDFPGQERYGAATFVLNGKGYIATGANDFGYLDDLWEYTPISGTWVQKTGLPLGSAHHDYQRREAFAFVIGTRAYLGGGEGFVFGANSTTNVAFYDLWEYNPSTDSWMQKADIPDFTGRNYGIGVAINNKGYVGLGCDIFFSSNLQTFWEYDPLADSWTSKADFPSAFTVDPEAFAVNGGLYIVGGLRIPATGISSQFYKYDPVANSWSQLSTFNGGFIVGGIAVSTGTAAFVGTGYDANLDTRKDLWEFAGATSIEQPYLSSGTVAKIYPNPSGSFVSIESEMEISSVEFYDQTGKLIFINKISLKSFNVENLRSGSYIIKLSFTDGTFQYIHFVKII